MNQWSRGSQQECSNWISTRKRVTIVVVVVVCLSVCQSVDLAKSHRHRARHLPRPVRLIARHRTTSEDC
jgi:hypothetical protein